jgi:Tfp pilus assembly protein PilX
MIDVTNLHRQRGWAGIVVLLLALLVIAILGQKMLHEYGLTAQATSGGPSSQKNSARPAAAATDVAGDATAATPVPANAIERARGMEAVIQQQADQAAKRIDDQVR